MLTRVQMVLLLRILWREKGYTKQDVSGSLAAANLTIGMLGGAILPPLGAYLYEQSDAATLSTSAATFVLAGYLPIAFIIWCVRASVPPCTSAHNRIAAARPQPQDPLHRSLLHVTRCGRLGAPPARPPPTPPLRPRHGG